MKIPHDFFQRKQHCGDRCIKRRSQSGSRPDRQEGFHFLGLQTQPARQHRGDAGSDVHRRAFAAQSDAAGQ